MSDLIQKMFAFIFEKEVGFSKQRAIKLASFFNEVDEFLSITEEQLRTNIRSVSGRPAIRLKQDEIDKIIEVSRNSQFDASKSIAENYLSILCTNFTKVQLNMVRNLTLDKVSPNPLLIKSLNLTTPKECVTFNLYALITRSVVTSMGFFVEKLLMSSSDSVEKMKDGWDLLKVTEDNQKHWIQVKSGPNDMDKDQVVYWSQMIQAAENNGDRAYIGITYGKRDNDTVTLGLFRNYLENWESKTLIGRELWDFVADDEEYHKTLFSTLYECGKTVLTNHSFCEEIDKCILRMTEEFISKYGDREEGVQRYVDDIF